MGTPAVETLVSITPAVETLPVYANSTTSETPNTGHNSPSETTNPWPEGTKFCHFRQATVLTKRGFFDLDVTAAYRYAEGPQRALEVGFAFCANSDMFSHAVGRQIAFERLESNAFSIPLRSTRHSLPVRDILDNLISFAIGTKTVDIPGLPNSWIGWVGQEPF